MLFTTWYSSNRKYRPCVIRARRSSRPVGQFGSAIRSLPAERRFMLHASNGGAHASASLQSIHHLGEFNPEVAFDARFGPGYGRSSPSWRGAGASMMGLPVADALPEAAAAMVRSGTAFADGRYDPPGVDGTFVASRAVASAWWPATERRQQTRQASSRRGDARYATQRDRSEQHHAATNDRDAATSGVGSSVDASMLLQAAPFLIEHHDHNHQ